MERAVIILGSANSDDGVISAITRARCDRAIREYHRDRRLRIIPTGGFGYFNRTMLPHACHIRRYCIARGVHHSAFIGCAQSTSTAEDAFYAHELAMRHGIRRVSVVTSDFHTRRASHIFRSTFRRISVHMIPSITPVTRAQYIRLCEKERDKMLRSRSGASPLEFSHQLWYKWKS